MANDVVVPDSRTYEVLPDGTELVIRPVRRQDRALIAEGFDALGADSRYQRFFTPKTQLLEEDLRFLTELDGDQKHALGIVAWDEQGHERPVGVARYVRLADAPDVADAAITIVDSMQGKGLGKLLLRKLSDAAYAHGVRYFRATVLSSNTGAIRLMYWLDPDARVVSQEPGSEELEVRLPPPRPCR